MTTMPGIEESGQTMQRRLLIGLLFGVGVLTLPGTANSFALPRAANNDSALVPISTVFYGFGKHTIDSFTDNYGLNYAIAGIASYGIVTSGFDWRWYRNAQENKWISNAGFVAVGVGPLASVGVPLGLYLYGRSREDRQMQITGLAVGQAAILAALVTSGLKAFTGREPPPEKVATTVDNSHGFRFGFLRGGVYEGWPSSHTATAFAMAVTLMNLYPQNSTIRYGGLAYASLIGLGVSTNIHWFSDAVAGACIGYAIGEAVGSGYRNLLDPASPDKSYSFSVSPIGFDFTYRF
jgi:membrane-associated phospholipid phosphatase